jgi:hypothetical protein
MEKWERSGQEVWDICKKRGKEVVRKQGISAGKRRAADRMRGISMGSVQEVRDTVGKKVVGKEIESG